MVMLEKYIGCIIYVGEIYLTTLPTLPIKNLQHLKNLQSNFLEIFTMVSSVKDTNTDVQFIKKMVAKFCHYSFVY